MTPCSGPVLVEIPDGELWDAHVILKQKMFATIRERARQDF